MCFKNKHKHIQLQAEKRAVTASFPFFLNHRMRPCDLMEAVHIHLLNKIGADRAS